MKIFITILLFFATAIAAHPESTHDWQKYFILYAESESLSSSTIEATYDQLYALEANPLNLNTATREELEALPFLTDRNVEDILEYINRHGPLKTMGELLLIKSIDYNQRQLLQAFTYAGDKQKPQFPSLKNILKYGKSDILATAKIPFYRRKGDINGYMGYQYKHNLRYDFTYSDHVRLGFLGAQDAGEPFFSGQNSLGYDFYSFYLVLKRLGCLQTLAVGRYRVKFGLGLVVNNNYSFGKLSALTSLQSAASNIRAHASLSDANYMQGVAATVSATKNIDVSAFVSYRKFDATLNKDSTIATILSSGYHRTETELSKKNNSTNFTAGGNISFRRSGFHIGATACYTSLDRELKPNTKAFYRRYYPAGKSFFNVGVDYGYINHWLAFSGETATGDCHAIATLNMLTLRVTDLLDITALYRNYSYKYVSLLSNSFSECGDVRNEQGAFLGASWRPIIGMTVYAYTDYAYFTWPRYQASQSSACLDNLVQVTYSSSDWMFTARYRLKIRQKDNKEKTSLTNKTDHRARLSAACNGTVWQLRTQADAVLSSFNDRSFGWMLTQGIGYNAIKRLKLNISAGYFDTDGYDARVYTYERGLRYSSFFPSFYGQGIRFTFHADLAPCKQFSLVAKVGTTKYFDRQQIGTGLNMIDHSSATDLELQAHLKF